MRSLSDSLLNNKSFLKNYSLQELETQFKEWDIPAFRARQVFHAYATRKATSFASIDTIPQTLREELHERLIFDSISPERKQTSNDGTLKFLFKLIDGSHIESVLIPSEMLVRDGSPRRLTLCISTQAGCPLGCSFCATATLNLKRNLETAEIIDQFLLVQQHSERDITNVVFMGMGEPLLNYDNVMKAVDTFIHPDAAMLSAKRITLSTAGVVPGIMRMADEKRPIKLALSLHATTNGLREKLMPIARKYSLEHLGNALEYYYRATKIPVTYEYILFDGLNDSDVDVRRLARISRRVPSKVNVIPFHSIDFTEPTGLAAELHAPSPEKVQAFIQGLQREHVHVMMRSSSGLDIDAACGQLALSHQSDTPELSTEASTIA